MGTIEVIEGGIFTTVQDLGRYGYQRYGVPVSGALDRFAIRVANLLVGNREEDAGLETTFMGLQLHFLCDSTIALAGGDLGPMVNGEPIPTWESVAISKDSILSFKGLQDGIRAYLCVKGGIDVPTVLSSRSTFTRSRLGGFEGRPLAPGDMIPLVGTVSDAARVAVRKLAPHNIPSYGKHHTLRVIMGPQDDAFTEVGIDTFLSSSFTFTPMFDRMGCRLDGPVIEHKRGADIVSDGTPCGSVQVTGNGMPIVLLADCGTTGGYTKIATIISVDLPKIGQAQPGDTITFRAASLEEAHRALREQEELIDTLRG
jgi:antagonist of KipI